MSIEAEVMREQLRAVRAEISKTAILLERLRDEERGLRLALARVAGEATSSNAVAEEVASSRTNGRSSRPRGGRLTPLVRATLEASAEPLDRHAIVDRLSEAGRQTTPDAVSASLSYLHRQGYVRSDGGLWAVRRSTDLDD